MKNEIMAKASRFIGKASLELKKHSPEIFMVAGIAGTVASTVMACKATTKVSKIMEEKNKTVEAINTCLADENIEYTNEDCKKDLTIVYAQTGVKLLKLYAPAIVVGTLSIASIVTGHRILRGRNLALAAAYTVVDKGFKDYRKNVVERFGSEIDKELRYNIKAKEIEEEITDENGNTTINKEIVSSVENPEEISEFARFFDDGNTGWTKDPEYNLKFLRCQQNYANDLLRNKGYLFLNEVYNLLGIPETRAGNVVGWIYDEKNPVGDNYVDFGIYKGREGNRLFVNGRERSVLLDFNVDGPILDLAFN